MIRNEYELSIIAAALRAIANQDDNLCELHDHANRIESLDKHTLVMINNIISKFGAGRLDDDDIDSCDLDIMEMSGKLIDMDDICINISGGESVRLDILAAPVNFSMVFQLDEFEDFRESLNKFSRSQLSRLRERTSDTETKVVKPKVVMN